MPTIRIDFDNGKVTDHDIIALWKAIQQIMRDITSIDDVFVYANSSQIKIDIAPIEVFVQLSASLVPDKSEMVSHISSKLKTWKQESWFEHTINLTLIPMDWKFEIWI